MWIGLSRLVGILWVVGAVGGSSDGGSGGISEVMIWWDSVGYFTAIVVIVYLRVCGGNYGDYPLVGIIHYQIYRLHRQAYCPPSR